MKSLVAENAPEPETNIQVKAVPTTGAGTIPLLTADTEEASRC